MSQMQALIGETLGSKYPYRIESVLGSGAMGVVYRATDMNKGRPAAVKVISGDIARGSKVQQRFEREAEILQQFRHPGIVRFLGYGKYRGTYYIAMEFIQGITLEKRLSESGPLPWREVVDLMIQVCDALHYAHERGVVHRDLKPSNLMVTEGNTVKLTDFGIAKDLDKESLTATGRTLGTAAYMAPEQIRGTPAVSHKTDLYALGIVLYQMLVGRPPYEGNSPVVLMHCHLNEPPPRPSDRVQEIPRALDDLVVTLMAKTPAERPWDAVAVGLILTTLRDKAERGERIPMVWSSDGSPDSNSARGGAAGELAVGRRKKKTRKASLFSTLTGSFYTTRSRAARKDTDESQGARPGLETLLLLGVLVAIGGLIVYLVWPPGQDYLYKHAEALMASSKHSDWVTARDEYLEPLDRRFPSNPYRQQTAQWRDKILLYEADSRAEILASPARTKLTEPNTHAERLFVLAHELAAEDSKRGDDLKAIERWKDMASKLHPDDKEERPWYLLAVQRGERLQAAIDDRRKFVEQQIQTALEAHNADRKEEAQRIINELKEQYAKYTDLADVFPKDTEQPAPGSATPQPPASPPATAGQGGAAAKKPAPASESEKPAAPAGASSPKAAGDETPAPASSESPAEPKSTQTPEPADPKNSEPDAAESLSEVNQQFDSEFRS
jgi:eukaryotic-like serine/threonine-protein kinase